MVRFTPQGALNISVPSPIYWSVLGADGQAVDNIEIFYQNDSLSKGYSVQVHNGVATSFTKDGEYRVTSYRDSNTQRSYPLNATFTIHDGHVNQPIVITIHAPNVVGTLKDASGDPIKHASLYMNLMSSGTGFTVEVKDGQFAFYALDGTYAIDNCYDYGNANLC